MKLEQWRASRQEGEAFVLPSGLEVRLKKVSMLDLVHGGQIPSDLRAPVAEVTKRRPDQPVDLADLEKFGPVLDLVAQACIVQPQGLDLAELPTTDKQEIFNWANTAAGKLRPFRPEQSADVESSFAVGDVPPEAKPDRRGR